MRQRKVFAAIIPVLLLLACGPSEEPEAIVEDIVKAAPQNVELLLDKPSISVIRVTLPPQARLPMHRGGDRVVYSLSDYKLRYLTPGTEGKIQDFRAGDIHWHSSGTHTVQNIGPIEARYLVVTRKGVNPTPGVTSNIAELAPDKARVIFENRDSKVIEITLQPKDKLPVHNAAGRAVYTLTAAKLRFTAGGQTTEEEWPEGAAHWHDGGEHAVENLSAAPVKFLIFEMM